MARLIQLSLMVAFGLATSAHIAVAQRTVALIGDLQHKGIIEFFREDNSVGEKKLIEQLSKEPIEHAMLLGDLTFWGFSVFEWAEYDEVMSPLTEKNVSLFPVLGNHEYFVSLQWCNPFLKKRFPWWDQSWYTKVIDSVAYVMLNTNSSDIDFATMKEQYRWYLTTMRDLDRADSVSFIVVCGHHPPYTNSTTVEPEDIFEKYFVPRFKKSRKGAFWFSGHCHGYERFISDGKNFIVSGGGGGPRQEIATGSSATFDDQYDGPSIRPLHYCLLQRNGYSLTMNMVPLKEAVTMNVKRDSITYHLPMQLASE